MTLLERLRELNGQGRLRKDGEDLAHWADRNKKENLWVRDIALPVLLEVVWAAKLTLDGSQDGVCWLENNLAKLEEGEE